MQVHPLESATQGHSPGVRTRANYPGASRADPGYHGPRVGSVCRPLLGPGRIVSGTLLSHHRRVGACMEDREVPTQVHSQDPDGAGGGPESARGHRMGGSPRQQLGTHRALAHLAALSCADRAVPPAGKALSPQAPHRQTLLWRCPGGRPQLRLPAQVLAFCHLLHHCLPSHTPSLHISLS